MRVVPSIALGLIGGLGLFGQSALGQLENMTGQKVQRFQGSSAHRQPPRRTPGATSTTRVKAPQLTPDQRAANLLMGVFGGMLSQALEPGPRSDSPGLATHDARQADIEARIAQQRQEATHRNQQALQSWAQSYADQLNQQLLGQRGGTAEGLSAAQSGLWDGGPSSPGGDPMVVDLRDARALTPRIPGVEPPVSHPVTVDEVLQRRAEAQARLQKMMAENGDLKVLGQRFYELEDQLAKLKKEAEHLGSSGREMMRENEAWGVQVDRAVQNSLERGTSLLTGTIIPAGTSKGMELLRKNPAVFNETLEHLSQVQNFTEFVTERADRIGDVREAVDWVQAKRNLYKDLDYIASNLGKVSKAANPLSTQWELGKNIVGSGLDVAQELDAWAYQKGAAGDHLLLRQHQQVVMKKMTVLVGDLRASREVLAARLGVRPEDLIPVQAKPLGLASSVPPI